MQSHGLEQQQSSLSVACAHFTQSQHFGESTDKFKEFLYELNTMSKTSSRESWRGCRALILKPPD